MWGLIKEILTSPFGSFASVFAASIFIIWLAFKAGSIIEKFKLVNKLESAIESIKGDLSSIKARIEVFQNWMEVFQKNSNPFAQQKSPVSLNKKGIEVAKKISADTILNKCWSKISAKIKEELDKRQDHNPYTVQEICFAIGQSYSNFFDKDDMDKVKTVAYHEGVDLSAFDLLIGISIRNRYFDENNINVKNVDKHDPAHK